MNIFITDTCPYMSAKNLCDQHCVKMALETCQLISTCLRLYHGIGGSHLMLSAYEQHPCSVWVSTSLGNLEWSTHHLRGILNQCRDRGFNKNDRYHRILSISSTFLSHSHVELLTLPPLCMPDDYKLYTDVDSLYPNGVPLYVVESYRAYYQSKALSFKNKMRYCHSKIPNWFVTNRDKILTTTTKHTKIEYKGRLIL